MSNPQTAGERIAWHRGFRWGALAGSVTVALAVCLAALR